MVVASLLYAVCLYRANGALDTLSPYIYYELLVIGNTLTSKKIECRNNSTTAVSHFINQVTKLFIVDKSNDLFQFRVSSNASFTHLSICSHNLAEMNSRGL